MKIHIFYSWQSDLPNKSNRSFIQDCLERAIKKLSHEFELELEFILDRDTTNLTGTPDIIDSIFKKIEKSYIFIGDVSIINFQEMGRKTPNPNVLIELGYAAKVIGWEKIICVYNSDYGKPEDLPFDIKFRRPLIYSTGNSQSKEFLITVFQKSIKEILTIYPPEKTVNDFLKMEIDTEILSFLNHLFKILKEDNESFNFKKVNEMLNYKKSDLSLMLKNKKLLGFRVFKNWNETEKKVSSFLESPLTKLSVNEEILKIIVSIIWRLKELENLFGNFSFYLETTESSNIHKVVSGLEWNKENKKYPNRLILLKHINNEKYLVEDFGDFAPRIDRKILTNYFNIREEITEMFAEHLIRLFKDIEKWLDCTDFEFIVDLHMFRPTV